MEEMGEKKRTKVKGGLSVDMRRRKAEPATIDLIGRGKWGW